MRYLYQLRFYHNTGSVEYYYAKEGKRLRMVSKIENYNDGRKSLYYEPTNEERENKHSYFGSKWKYAVYDGEPHVKWDGSWLMLNRLMNFVPLQNGLTDN